MKYCKSFRKKSVSPDGKVVTESTGYVEISSEGNTKGSSRVSTRVSAHSSSSSFSISSDVDDWQEKDEY